MEELRKYVNAFKIEHTLFAMVTHVGGIIKIVEDKLKLDNGS